MGFEAVLCLRKLTQGYLLLLKLLTQDLADELGYEFFEASAKTAAEVQNTFTALVSAICMQVRSTFQKLNNNSFCHSDTKNICIETLYESNSHSTYTSKVQSVSNLNQSCLYLYIEMLVDRQRSHLWIIM